LEDCNQEHQIVASYQQLGHASLAAERSAIGVLSHVRAGLVCSSQSFGVYEAGGIPLELPVVSLGETLPRPTAT
jgi:hypothetical protein